MTAWRDRLRRTFYELRVEGEGPGREAAALGLGVFIGCTPFYGFHLILCWIAGWALRLNRLKLYLAANISNPLFAPFLVFVELQAGAWMRRSELHDLTIASLRTTDPWTFGGDLIVGSALVGCLLGVAIAAATLATGGMRREDPAFAALWRRASDPYLQAGITAWEFARGKLRGDPVYRTILQQGMLVSGGSLLDLGCGGGLALSAIREAVRSGPPFTMRFDRLIGVELRERAAKVARRALGPDVLIVNADARAFDPPPCSTVLLLDVLHMLAKEDQERLIERVAGRLDAGGVVVVREADAAAGAGFMAVRAGNRLKAIVTGNWRQRFAFRSAVEWTDLLERLGLQVESRGAADGTPFANVLLVGKRPALQATLNERADARTPRRAIPPVGGRRIGYSSPR